MTTLTAEPKLEEKAASAPPTAPPAPDRNRQYVVLSLVDGTDNDWRELGTYEAGTSEEAIRKVALIMAADPDVDTSGTLTYVAVPARSFQPVELTAKVEPKIEFRSR